MNDKNNLELVNEDELNKIDSEQSKYSIEQKIKVIIEYVITGDLKQAAELANVNYSSVRMWRERSLWWPEIAEKIRKEHNDELDGQITKVISKGVKEALDRMENGDEVFDSEGNKRTKKVSLRDLTTSLAILFDKRQKIRESINGVANSATKDEMLEVLKKKMEDFAVKIRQDTQATIQIENDKKDA